MNQSDKWVEVSIPPRFSGGLESLAAKCGWRTRRQGERQLVCLDERYLETTISLLSPLKLAEASTAALPAAYAPLSAWPLQDARLLGQTQIELEVGRLLQTGVIEDLFAGFQLAVLTSAQERLQGALRQIFTAISSAMPNARLWTIQIDDRLQWRLAAIRSLFGSLEAPELLARSPDDFRGFPSARGLQISSVAHDELIIPALMATSPFLLGVASGRYGGQVILLFGEALAGIRPHAPPTLLSLHRPLGLTTPERMGSHKPDVSIEQAEAGLSWWTNRINALLNVVLDPARYRDHEGHYDPRAQMGDWMSISRLFVTVQAILSYSLRDEFVRKVLFFNALDLLQGLRQGDYKRLLSHERASAIVEQLEATMPGNVAHVLLPKCREAVQAIARLKEGFFLSERIEGDQVRFRDKKGGWQTYSADRAVSEYLQVVRNSTHSFRQISQDRREVSLLASHDGELPAALADLPFLHLIALITAPGSLFQPMAVAPGGFR